jgi:hypothetical protein
MKYREWISWDGGECPVPPDTWVEVYPRQGLDMIGPASRYNWRSRDIFRYRLCAPDEHKEAGWTPEPLFEMHWPSGIIGKGPYVVREREVKPESPNDHYRQGEIECIDAIRAALTDEEWRGYCKGNIIKYTWRERHKGGDASLVKAEDYLRWAMAGKAEDKR